MRTRTLSMAALVVALLAALALSLAVQPGSDVAASHRSSNGCWELVENEGFEDTSDWVISITAYPAAYSTSEKRSGSRSMRLGIPPGNPDQYAWSSVYQDVAIPLDAESATLSFWYKPYSDDTSGWDIQGMIIYDTYWNLLWEVLDVHSNSKAWTHVEVDVSVYAGQTVRLYFYVSNNSSYQWGETSMYVDDVSLEWCSDEPGVVPTAQLGVDPREKTVTAHEGPFEMSVLITDAVDLGAFEFDLVYDPDVVLVEDVQLESFLERTGRTAYSGTDDSYRLDGRFGFWAYTTPPGGDPGREGPSGKGVLVTTFLSPVDDGTTPLELDEVKVFDTDGDEITAELFHGTIIVEECFGDVNHDGVVDVEDVMLVAATWGCEEEEDDCYDEDYDLNDSGEIDVGDIMAVVANWGDCETDVGTAILQPAGVSGGATSIVKVEPRENSVDPEESFTVSVSIEYVADLGAFQFSLRYDPALLQVTDVTLGDLLGSTGRSLIDIPVVVDHESGRVTVAGASYGSAPGPNEDGLLADVTLTARRHGKGDLWLENVKVLDTDANRQGTVSQGAAVSVSASDHVYLPLIVRQ
jgi:hypothetical protein